MNYRNFEIYFVLSIKLCYWNCWELLCGNHRYQRMTLSDSHPQVTRTFLRQVLSLGRWQEWNRCLQWVVSFWNLTDCNSLVGTAWTVPWLKSRWWCVWYDWGGRAEVVKKAQDMGAQGGSWACWTEALKPWWRFGLHLESLSWHLGSTKPHFLLRYVQTIFHEISLDPIKSPVNLLFILLKKKKYKVTCSGH
jgi:hypothetical protein